MHVLSRSIGCLALAVFCSSLHAQKLKIYILAGQSNMEGHAKVSTFGYIGDDAATAPLLKEMLGKDGSPRVCENAWISYLTGMRASNGIGTGKLTAGYGSRRNPAEDGGKIGPEFTFGLRVAHAYDGPILIIKTAWGGKSLHTDFRSPSAGPYQFSPRQIEQMSSRKKNVEQEKANKLQATGHYYRLMIEHVQSVLAELEKVCPDYDSKQGYELAGFAWFQGWNDMVDRGTYPNRDKSGGYDQYSECMAHFIRDVRKDLSAPEMPFVIGVMGVGGPVAPEEAKKRVVHTLFRAAMAAPAALKEFRGNVTAVPTSPFWDTELSVIADKMGKVKQMARMLRTENKKHANRDGSMSKKEQKAYVDDYRAKVVGAAAEARFKRGASNAGYHYLGCAKTMALIGVAFADAMLAME